MSRTRDALVAALGATATVAIVWFHRGQPASALALGGLVGVSTWLSIIDFRHHRLPNRIVGPLAVAVTVAVVLAGLIDGDASRAGRAGLIGGIASAVLLVGNLLGGLGMGDVKFGYPAAAALGWFGLSPLATAAMVMAISGAVGAVVVLAMGRGRRHALPYGPYMVLGLVVGLLTAGTP